MSLVGTRPILQDELQKYELHHRARIAIKPGITGMWQVSGSYRTMIGIADDGITEKKKTLVYFPKNSIYQYREFVEDIGHKYIVQEQHIRKMIGEDELWLPW